MSDHQRIPCDIPGLERKGSPCLGPKGGRFTLHPNVGPAGFAIYDDGTVAPAPRVRWLDLSDPTARWHAWLWLADNGVTLWMGDVADAIGADTALIDKSLYHACRGAPMTPGEIDILRRVVLNVAGRAAGGEA